MAAADISFFQESITAFQANLLGADFDGIKIFLNGGVFLITPSCTGFVSASILGAIIFSLKKPKLKQKIGIFLAGAVLLMVANQFRLYFVLLSGKFFWVQTAELVHVASWFATTAAIIFAWYYFTKKTAKIKDFEGFL